MVPIGSVDFENPRQPSLVDVAESVLRVHLVLASDRMCGSRSQYVVRRRAAAVVGARKEGR